MSTEGWEAGAEGWEAGEGTSFVSALLCSVDLDAQNANVRSFIRSFVQIFTTHSG